MQNEGRNSAQKSAEIEGRLLEFAVRVGKAVDALQDHRQIARYSQIQPITTVQALSATFFTIFHFQISITH